MQPDTTTLDEEAIQRALQTSEMLGGLAEQDVRVVRERGALVTFEAGASLLTADQLNGRVFVLLDGQVEVVREGALGVERVARLGAGACLGEMSALTRRPATLTVRAIGVVRALALDGVELLEQLRRVPGLGGNLANILMERLQGHLTRRATSLSLISVDVADAAALETARQLVDRTARLCGRTVIVDLSRRLPASDRRSLPPIEAWDAEGRVPQAVERELRATARGSFLLPVDGRSDARARLDGVLDLVAPLCDQVLIVAEPSAARGLLEAHPTRYRRLILVGSDARFTGEVERRRVLVAEPGPRTVAEGRAADARHGALTYGGLGAGARGLEALARDLAGARIGLALGAGASRGFGHIGVLERLTERGVPIDAIVGSSSGAGVGCLWSFGDEPDRIARLFGDLQQHAVGWTFPYRSLLSGARLHAHLRRCADGRGFGDTLWPYGAVAVDLYAACERLFTEGEIDRCVLASCAIPGIYPPVQIDGRWYVDGGLLHPVPTEFARPLGVDRVIAVDLGAAKVPEVLPPRGPHLLEVLRGSARLMHARITEHSRLGADVILRPGAAGAAPSMHDYERAAAWRDLGRAAVDASWAELEASLPWLGSPESVA